MPLPSTIRKRDGRLQDFEADKLSRSLFMATEAIGSPNAFLARELTDGVLHFLEADEGTIENTGQLVELTAKVVRELGHPAIAKIHGEIATRRSTTIRKLPASGEIPVQANRNEVDLLCQRAAASELQRFSLQHVYPRVLVAAHQEGLFELLDLEVPFELAGLAFPKPYPLDRWMLFERLRDIRTLVGKFVAIEIPDHVESEAQARQFVETFGTINRTLGLRGILNLNTATNTVDGEPLFTESSHDRQWLDRIADECLHAADDSHCVWHLAERDFQEAAAGRLQTVLEIARSRENVEFAFDQPKRPIILGPSISRNQPAALGAISLQLDRFVRHLGSSPISRDIYLQKLKSLARFATSAGQARLNFLRKNGDPRLREGFLLDRAVFVVAPMGILESARSVAGPMVADETIAELACDSLTAIRSAIEIEPAHAISMTIDFPLENRNGFGFTDAESSTNKQMRYAKRLTEAAGGGFTQISLKRNGSEIVNIMREHLQAAWRGELTRLRFDCSR